jgi:hypothetical protein
VSVAHLDKWDPTAIEIALDLEVPPFADPSSFGFTGPAEPRICLVAAFALTPQLKRIVAAVDRALPLRLPSTLRIAPSRTRSPAGKTPSHVSIRPMPSLIRIQAKLIRAIAPGLADSHALAHDMDKTVSHFIHDFIPSNALPLLEPSDAQLAFALPELKPLGITMYRLDRLGKPRSILGHWAYAPDARRSDPLRSGP